MWSIFRRDWKPSTPPLDVTNYEAIRNSHARIAIHFWASWNRVDRQFDATIRGLSQELRKKVYFMSCDLDDARNEPIARDFAVAALPSLGLMLDGVSVGAIVGARNPDDLVAELKSRFAIVQG